MGNEVRNRKEGFLYWVQASGTGSTWATASGAATALMAFVRDWNFTSAQTVVTIMDRGEVSHHKVQDKQQIGASFTIAHAITAQFPHPNIASGSGASVPMMHLEFKQAVPENANITGQYYQLHGVAIEQFQLTEGDAENTLAYTVRALAMNGPTASGYIG